jgi:hypothetical protein
MQKILISLLIIAVLLSHACSNGNEENGLLQGMVTVGPINPVERPGAEFNTNCLIYEVRKIIVYDGKGTNLVIEVDIVCEPDNKAYYQVWLSPGKYIIDINRIGIDSSSTLPQVVEIVTGKTHELNVDIDTGIR